ncbi:MAG: dipeptidyl-peptidase 3 family protein [Gemmatimonadota bacterium]
MTGLRKVVWTGAIAALLLGGCTIERNDEPMALAEGVTEAELEERVASFAPTSIAFDETALEDWEKAVLAKLVEASDIMHDLFGRQVAPENPEWAERVANRGENDPGAIYYDIMVGPWDRQAEHRPFLAVGEKPAGAGYYPVDLTREELQAYIEAHPEQRDALTDPFTLVERRGDALVAVPYSRAFGPELRRAAELLRDAAALSENETLSSYLESRAESFLSNDYYPSDMAWMDIEGTRIEPTIGPYEVYEDNLMGYKAAFESFVTVADARASAELDTLKGALRTLEENLPIPDRMKNLDRGFESPMRVVDVVYTAGDTRAGVQTIAFNLPNDERVRAAKGSKKVMLRNVSQAKFDQILRPIARAVLDPAMLDELAFQPWFTSVLMHELAHGLGPGYITRNGERITVNQALEDRYSAIEEVKADVVGLHNLTVLRDRGLYDDDFVRAALVSELPDYFRSIRFGATEAHGRANLIQFNWLLEKGALEFDQDGMITADLAAMEEAVRSLATEVLTLQAEGDYERAGELIARYGQVSPEIEEAVARLADVPVDVRPQYEVRRLVPEWREIANRLAPTATE